MRGVLFIVLIAVLASLQSATGQSAALGQYNEANNHYRGKEYEAARQAYLQVVAAGVRDARLFYNLGNACFKIDRLGEAILWYERALRLAPRDADIKANLAFANQAKEDKDPPPQNPLGRWLEQLYGWPSIDELCITFSVLFAAIFALASWRVWQGGKVGAGWLAALSVCLGLAVANGLFVGARLYQHHYRVEAIVTTAEGTARSGPGEGETAVFVLHEGTKVRLERRENPWVLVRLANGLGGWLPAAAIEEI
ncbi:MAG: tetratricopeptide repeat protein [Candidatus Latescibacteria bacterium]|nr:tetratricopeptide repeat protein [Candidatus Latescibacterota bacterium]